jgi:hypothetical protein
MEAAAMPHGRFYNFSDAQMVVAIASHRSGLLGLVDVCYGRHPLFDKLFGIESQLFTNCKFFVSGFFICFPVIKCIFAMQTTR